MALKHPCPGAVITQRFGVAHPGLDLALYRGAPIVAAEAGEVTVCQWDVQGYGNRIDIEHTQHRVATRYAHLERWVVCVGQLVSRGQVIGYMGNTGNVIPVTGDGTHLHFEVIPLPRDWNSATAGRVDPEPWLVQEVQEEEVMVGKHILALHLQRNAELGSEPTETIRASNIPRFKAMDVDAWGHPPNVMFPGKEITVRLHFGGSDGDKREHELMRQGAAGAREYIRLMQARIDKCIAGGIRHFEGPNEIHPNDSDNPWDVFLAFQWELARYYVGRGCHYWALSLGVGWFPNIADIVRFKHLLLYCAEHGGGLAVHEYGCPGVLDGNGWWTMRIRRTLDALYDAGVARMTIPVKVTEAGITWALRGDADTGYNSHSGWVYPAENGLPAGIMTRERVFRQMLAYEARLLAEAPEVIEVDWFTTLPFSDWITFDVNTEMVGWVCALYEAEPEPPIDEQPVMPAVEAIREAAWNEVGVAYNPEAAFQAYARAHGLGVPLSGEFDLGPVRAQAFAGGIVWAVIGDWANVKQIAW